MDAKVSNAGVSPPAAGNLTLLIPSLPKGPFERGAPTLSLAAKGTSAGFSLGEPVPPTLLSWK